MELQIIQRKIFEVRGCRVMLDFHLAELYQVETRALKQAVRRNMDRFPDDFMFELSRKESDEIIKLGISQIVIPPRYNVGTSFVMAFTEQGIAMLSSILRSKIAIQMNIAVMRAFVLMRQMIIGYEELRKRIEQLEISTDAQFSEIYRALTELLSKKESDEKPRRPVGFHTYNE
jgi:hypothetical protein